MTKVRAVLVDVDGTLVDVSTIRHHVEGPKRDFDAFHRASIDCPPISPVVNRVNSLHESGLSVIVISGREDRFRRLTDFWLAMWNIPCERLLMRRTGDWRADVILKREFFEDLSQSFEIVEVIDDRDDLLAMWKTLDIPSVVDVHKLAS